MNTPKPKNVDEYIANATPEGQLIMEELRQIIKSTIPEVEEVISWNVPIYKYYGILAGFDIFKHHISFGADVLSEEDRETLKKKGYKTGKKTIQIKFDQKVPSAIIRKILKEQAKINKAK